MCAYLKEFFAHVNLHLTLDSAHLTLDSAHLTLDSAHLTFLSLINKGFHRPELIELIEQERRYALFDKDLGWFWCLWRRFASQ